MEAYKNSVKHYLPFCRSRLYHIAEMRMDIYDMDIGRE